MIKASDVKASENFLVLQTVRALRGYVADQRRAGHTIALVPTMGALHDGHMELVRQGLARAGRVIVSIFVNPTQFGPNEDFTAYPRTWDADLEKLKAAGAHAVLHPSTQEMYPPGFATTVSVAGVSRPLEGTSRPGHFDGVATIVTKLFLQTLPDIALFGEKDYQQLQVIRRITADLDIPVEIIGVPTVRDGAGLALSSRNAYLSAEQYKIAVQFNKILFAVAGRIGRGETPDVAQAWGIAALKEVGFDSIDYLTVCNAQTLLPAAETAPAGTLRILAAVRLGRTRLIDNIPVTAG